MTIKEEDLYKIKMAGYDRLRPDRTPLFLWGTIVFGGVMLVVALFGVIQADLQVNPLLLTAVFWLKTKAYPVMKSNLLD